MAWDTVGFGESEDEALDRIIKNDIHSEGRQAIELVRHAPISYCTVGGEEAGELKGLVDAAIISCYSYEAPEDWEPIRGHGEVSARQGPAVKKEISEGSYTPPSTLSMLRFLTSWRDEGGITEKDTSRYGEIVEKLYRQLPHWEGVMTDSQLPDLETLLDSQESGICS